MGSHLHFYNCLCSRIMSLSRKLTTMEEQMSCDPQYLAKVSLSLHFGYMFAELVCINYWSLITQYMFIMYMFRLGEKDRDLTSMTLILFLRNLTYEVILISLWSMEIIHDYENDARPHTLLHRHLLFKEMKIFLLLFYSQNERCGYLWLEPCSIII